MRERKSFYLQQQQQQRIKAAVVEFLKSAPFWGWGAEKAFSSEIYYFVRFWPTRLLRRHSLLGLHLGAAANFAGLGVGWVDDIFLVLNSEKETRLRL